MLDNAEGYVQRKLTKKIQCMGNGEAQRNYYRSIFEENKIKKIII
jgi:hypothetical protein